MAHGGRRGSGIAGLSLTEKFNRASTAITAIRREPSAVVLLDVNLSDGNGREILPVVAAEYPMTKVIVVSKCADPMHRKDFTKAGACAFSGKSHELAAICRMLASLVGVRPAASL